MNSSHSKLVILVLFVACAHSSNKSAPRTLSQTLNPAPHEVTKSNPAIRTKGYGDFLFIPPDSMAIRNFIDKDEDGVDDRYQLAPGTQGMPLGSYYKK